MILAHEKMAPDSITAYTESAYRLVRVDVKEAVFRPIHQRRPAIAIVTNKLRVILSTHADIARPGTTEPYWPTLGRADMTVAAYPIPKGMSATCQAQRGDHVPMEAASNIICKAVSVKCFNTDNPDE